MAVPWSLPGQSVYAASKIAIEQVARTLSRELDEMNIRVNTIGLPPMRTALTRSVKSSQIEALFERQAIKRMCTIRDILVPIEFLLSPASQIIMRLFEAGLLTGLNGLEEPVLLPKRLRFDGIGVEYEV